MALDEMNRAMGRDEFYYWIQSRRNFQRVQATRLEFATQEGIKQGIELGIKQGIELGIKLGLELVRVNVAVKLLSTGIPLDAISQATGLSQEELEALRATDT